MNCDEAGRILTDANLRTSLAGVFAGATQDLWVDKDGDGTYPPDVILDFDYWAVLPRRA